MLLFNEMGAGFSKTVKITTATNSHSISVLSIVLKLHALVLLNLSTKLYSRFYLTTILQLSKLRHQEVIQLMNVSKW